MKKSRAYQVFWTDAAERDVATIADYLVSQNPSAALTAWRRIQSSAERLASFPGRGRVVPELKRYGISTYRELIANPWRILYRIEDKKVYVIIVADVRRNFESILLGRFGIG
jgi:plasmid stabilization system protein ParE